MKGASKFLMKGIYLILALLVISLFINRIFSVNVISSEERAELRFSNRASNLLEVLSGSIDCLAYEEIGNVEGKEVELTTHKVLDKQILDGFGNVYADTEPDCARDFEFGYRVEVKTFPVSIKTEEARHYGVFGEVLKEIKGKNVLFVSDVSGTMKDDAGLCRDSYPGEWGENSKFCCLKKFLDNFAEHLDETSRASIVIYGVHKDKGGTECGDCGHKKCCSKNILSLTQLNPAGKNRMKSVLTEIRYWDGGTPIINTLATWYDFSEDNNIQAVVLLTDGKESDYCCGGLNPNIVESYRSRGIPIHTIGFGKDPDDIDMDLLEKIAEDSDGKFFYAKVCEELVAEPKEPLSFTIDPEEWSFGSSVFSKNDALERQITISTPIVVYYNQSKTLPGTMKITLTDGELERFVGFVEHACLSELSIRMYFHYPVSIEIIDGKNNVCMEFLDEKRCQPLACEENIEFEGIKTPGNYIIQSELTADGLRIKV